MPSSFLNDEYIFHSDPPEKDINPSGNPEKIFLYKAALKFCQTEKMIAPRVRCTYETGFHLEDKLFNPAGISGLFFPGSLPWDKRR